MLPASSRLSVRAKCAAVAAATVAAAIVLTDDAGSTHLGDLTVGVGDHPVAVDQLRGLFAFVRYSNRVDEEPVAVVGRAPRGRVLGLDLDTDALGACTDVERHGAGLRMPRLDDAGTIVM